MIGHASASNSGARRGFRIAAWVVAIAALVGLAKPAFFLTADAWPYGDFYCLKWDYGIPTDWRSAPDVPLPSNSVGLDFLSIDIYVRCAGIGPQMYQDHCIGDPGGRPFAYPPLLAAGFYWVRWIPTASAAGIWSLAVLLLLGVSGIFWTRLFSDRKDPTVNICAFMTAFFVMISYPAVFAFVRGNTDVLVLVLLSLAAWDFKKGGGFGVGLWTSLATVLKVYPGLVWFGCAMMGVGWLLQGSSKKKFFMFAAGSLMGFLVPIAVMPAQHADYFLRVLPTLAAAQPIDANCAYCHSWPAAYLFAGKALSVVLSLVGIIALVFSSRCADLRSSERGLHLGLLGFGILSAVAVYVPQTSFDYSLILLIPLIMTCVAGGMGQCSLIRDAGLLALLTGAVMPRWLEGTLWPDRGPSVFLLLQTTGLILIAVFVVFQTFQIRKDPN